MVRNEDNPNSMYLLAINVRRKKVWWVCWLILFPKCASHTMRALVFKHKSA